MLIVKEPQGRLGNQIFQILGLISLARKIDPDCQWNIILFGFSPDCQHVLELHPSISLVTPSNFVYRVVSKIKSFYFLKSLLWILARHFVVYCSQERLTNSIRLERGRFSFLTGVHLVGDAYFQSPQLLDMSYSCSFAKLRTSLCDAAQSLLSEASLRALSRYCVIHIRRGDYASWPSKSLRAILPMQFYIDCLGEVKKDLSIKDFFVTSDDFDYCLDFIAVIKSMEEFNGISIWPLELSPPLTVAALAIAPVKIIGSSFSWIAAILGFSLDAESDPAIYAPMYWSGHRSKQWFPPFSYWDKVTYIDVK